MIFFRSDYSQGAHPKVMEALMATNLEHTDGYGLDIHCENAAAMVKSAIGIDDCEVYMMVGGTPCNITTIAAALRPYESVVALKNGHAYFHETGGVEATGHRIVAMDGINGKITPELIDRAWDEYEDEHTPLPRLLYISQPTEIGSIYSKAEMTALSEKCKERDMLLYVDGARLGTALTCRDNDLSIMELAQMADAFYIGGTKNGALFGEALVIKDKATNDHFRWMIKRQNGLLAKGRLIGVQFEALLGSADRDYSSGLDAGISTGPVDLENSLLFQIARHENELAEKLRSGMDALGVEFYSQSSTNQSFPILPTPIVEELEKEFFFYRWAPEQDGKTPIRLVTSWGSQESDIDAFLTRVKKLL